MYILGGGGVRQKEREKGREKERGRERLFIDGVASPCLPLYPNLSKPFLSLSWGF